MTHFYRPIAGTDRVETVEASSPIAPQACSELDECRRLRLDPTPTGPRLLRVVLPYAVFGALSSPEGTVLRIAPIGRWALGRHVAELAMWARRRGGEVEAVGGRAEGPDGLRPPDPDSDPGAAPSPSPPWRQRIGRPTDGAELEIRFLGGGGRPDRQTGSADGAGQ